MQYALFLFAHLILGLILVLGGKKLSAILSIHSSFLTCLVLLLLNLLYAYVFKLPKAISTFWSWRKVYFLIIGFVAGFVIAVTPLLLGSLSNLQFSFQDLALSSFGVTFLIVFWEELWFRSIILNFCNRQISVVNLAIINGILFLAFHFLNPNIDLWDSGANLFFAGSLLTLLYFYYQNLWLPLGLHFGNNLLGSMSKSNVEDKLIFGEEGLISTILLAILFLIYLKKTQNRGKAVLNL